MALFKVDSALLALVNIELPLEARPPIPSPFGLWRRTNSIRKTPEIAHAQDKSGMIIFIYYAGWGTRFGFLGMLIGSMSVEPVIDSIHIAEAVLYMAKLPVTVNVLNMTVMANKMPFVGRG